MQQEFGALSHVNSSYDCHMQHKGHPHRSHCANITDDLWNWHTTKHRMTMEESMVYTEEKYQLNMIWSTTARWDHGK